MGTYSLIAEHQNAVGKAIQMDMVRVKLAGEVTLAPNDISVVGQDDKDVKHSARRGAWIAYQELARQGVLNSESSMARSGVAFDFAGSTFNQISGPSAGLCFLVRMAQALIEEHLRSKGAAVPCYELAATGIISSVIGDRVHAVQAITAKLKAGLAVLPKGGIVFYPTANDPLDSPVHQEAARKGIMLIGVDTPEQVITFLLKQYGISERPKPGWSDKWWAQAILSASVVLMLFFLWWISWTPSQPVAVSPGSSTPVGISSLAVRATLLYRGQDGSPIPLPAGKSLTQEDGFRVEVETNQNCFLYAFEVDSVNRIEWLFPPEPDPQPLPKGRRQVPNDKDWFELDEVQGEEQVYILATTQRSSFLEEKRETITRSKSLQEAERQALKTVLVSYLERRGTEHGDAWVRLLFQHK